MSSSARPQAADFDGMQPSWIRRGPRGNTVWIYQRQGWLYFKGGVGGDTEYFTYICPESELFGILALYPPLEP
jgi:hypothetical protein